MSPFAAEQGQDPKWNDVGDARSVNSVGVHDEITPYSMMKVFGRDYTLPGLVRYFRNVRANESTALVSRCLSMRASVIIMTSASSRLARSATEFALL